MMSERSQLLDSLNEAHERLVTAAMDAAGRGMKDPWGPREILAHVVGWEAMSIARLPRLLAGEPPLTYDEQAVNIAMVTLIGDQPIEVFRTLLSQVHQRFVQMPEVQDEASFVPGHPIYERAKRAIAHSLEHVQELERRSFS
jgi:hypothetical protein